MSDISCIFCASVLECNAITYNDVLVYSSHKNNGLPSIYYLTVYRLLITLFAVPFGVLVIHSRHDYPELALIWLMCIYNNIIIIFIILFIPNQRKVLRNCNFRKKHFDFTSTVLIVWRRRVPQRPRYDQHDDNEGSIG